MTVSYPSYHSFTSIVRFAQNRLQPSTTILSATLPQSTYITRVPQCLFARPNWDPRPPSPASECVPPPGTYVGGDTPEEVEGPNSDDWTKSLVLCLLCGHCTMPFPVLITNCHPLFLQPSHTVHICRCSTVL
jgi:hypothetical protein